MNEQNKTLNINITLSTIIKFALVPIIFLVLFYLLDLVLAVLGAIVVASAVEPVAKWLIKRRVPRLPAIIFIYVVLAGLALSVVYFLVIPLLRESISILSTLPSDVNLTGSGEITEKAGQLIPGISENLSLADITAELNELVSNLSNNVVSSISLIFGGVLSFILIVVLSFYLAVQEDGVGQFLKKVSPVKNRDYVVDLWRRSQEKIGLWMQGQIILMVLVTVLVYLGLALFGVEHALLLAVLAGAFELIPLFGPILAAVPAVFIGYVGGGVSLAVLVGALYLIIQQFENHLIYPLVVKKVVGVSPIVSIIAIVAGTQLAGFMGLILSVPIAAVFMELLKDFQKGQMALNKPLEKKNK